MMLSKDVMGTSNQIVFDIPPGIPMNTVRKAIEGLKTTSGNNFLEIHSGITDEKHLSRKEKEKSPSTSKRTTDRYHSLLL